MSFEDLMTKGKPGIEIHFDERVIDHPMVPIRWCLSKEALAYMRQHSEFDWALVIVAQQPERRDERAGKTQPGNQRAESRLVIEGFEEIGRGHDYFQFRGTGEHVLTAFLVHSRSSSERKSDFWKSVRSLMKRENSYYTKSIDLDSRQQGPFSSRDADLVTPYTRQDQTIVIPDGIFAAEMKPWLKNYLCFFGLGVGEDECAGRWRIGMAFSIAPLCYAMSWLIFAPLARLYAFGIGVGHFLFGGNPLGVWQRVVSKPTILMEGFDDWRDSERFKLIPFYNHENRWFLTPIVLFLVFGLPALALWLTSFGQIVALIIGAIVAIVAFFGIFGERLFDAVDESSKKNVTRKHEQLIDKVERYTLCGNETKQPETIRLYWSGMKRMVCKPRQMAS
jgi:hypothetical protein